HAGAVGHAARERGAPAGRAGPPAGHVRAAAHRRAGERGTRPRSVRPALGPLAEKFRALLHLDDPPHRLALALAVGVFIGCTPFWGLQTILCAVVATVCRLNRAAAVTGAWIILPWFAPFVYGAALELGLLVVPGSREANA